MKITLVIALSCVFVAYGLAAKKVDTTNPFATASGNANVLHSTMIELLAKGDTDGLNAISEAVDELIGLLHKDVAAMQKRLDDAANTHGDCKSEVDECGELVASEISTLAALQTEADNAGTDLVAASTFGLCKSGHLSGDGSTASDATVAAMTTALEDAAATYKTKLDEKKAADNAVRDQDLKIFSKKAECYGKCVGCVDSKHAVYKALKQEAEERLPGEQDDLRTYELIKCVAKESANENRSEKLAECRSAETDVSSIKYDFHTLPEYECGEDLVCHPISLPEGVVGDDTGKGACKAGEVLSAYMDNECGVKCADGYFKSGTTNDSGASTVTCPKDSSTTMGMTPKGQISCELKTCTCRNGHGATGTSCPAHDTEYCTGCSIGYRLEDNKCVKNVCTCDNGWPEPTCPTNGGHICSHCHHYHHLSGGRCYQNACVCSHGRPAPWTDCPTTGSTLCSSCDSNYYLRSNQCKNCIDTPDSDATTFGNCKYAANRLNHGEELRKGTCLTNLNSYNGKKVEFCFERDSNLVVRVNGSPKWAMWDQKEEIRNQHTDKLKFQDDDNFVMYDGGSAKWHSDTQHSGGRYIVVQNDCNVVMYDDYGNSKWNTGTYGC